ncbi:MAG: YpdA family putative bacillithiol disulfide reductase [Acidobacteria bacterium]|nr:YpdA family putative bacillithiol disulfide reductase [Acidobacteriota bacterium]
MLDAVVIGAGPTGLACGIELGKRGLKAVLIEKGCVVNSLYNYPTNLVFFTTPELLEIGGIPMTAMNEKPTRNEALKYYRRVADHYKLDIRQYELVERVEGSDGNFVVHSSKDSYACRKVIFSTGYYDLPNYLNVPGENLPKVIHYYREPHPYYNSDVLVVGAKNSAALAALELWWTGARVTLVHHGPGIHNHVKYWIKPNIENRIKNGEIPAYFNSSLREILPGEVVLDTPEGEVRLKNDFVFAMTGYHPDFDFLGAHGIHLNPETRRPNLNAETFETERPGMYLAGVLVAGVFTNEVFIENGRFHGEKIAESILHSIE